MRRPILVYIHNDDSQVCNTFCKTVFCSSTIIDYLLDNYIVWPWDITFQSNKNTLMKIWEEVFSIEFLSDFFTEEWPLMIGIMRRFEYKTDRLITSDYQFQPLLKSDNLMGKQKSEVSEIVLNKLRLFKKQFDENEQVLSFNFVESNGLSWEVILETAKYLSLNDAISAFSTNILSLLQHHSMKFQLSNPDIPFIQMILRKVKPEQIVSLQLDGFRLWSRIELTFLSTFTNIISMTLLNLPYDKEINKYEKYFPNLTCLSLCYDNEINLDTFSSIFNQFWDRIKRFEIRCAGVLCTHYTTYRSNKSYQVNSTVKYFLFDVGQFPLISMSNYYECNRLCCLKSIIILIKQMANIRCVHFIINKYDIEAFMDIHEWEILVQACSQLKNIKLQILDRMFQNDELTQKVFEIQTALHNIRQTIRFQIFGL
ncbi:unnamed protein product [Rotaria sp. Silwood1]|nr:unnamed protein product [Rotaria sp. Silwood1]